jgi:microcompartment protein CcmL/EutN
MTELIKKAQLNILPSFVSHGADNAILHSMMIGRHIITNKKANTLEALNGIIHYVEEPSEFINKITQLFEQPFELKEIETRACYLNTQFDDLKSAKKLIKLLY